MSTPFTHTTADGREFTGRTNVGRDLAARSGAPLVIALHGGTYSSQYFDIPGHSLLDNASALGIPVIALDRPNYGGSSPLTSEDSIIFANAEIIGDAIGSIWK
jgi:pimeloyl-ACP methyl ester carboxylesterase